ncbi:patatin-like phospholipase family protein [Pseudomonas sp. NPDC088368]|uniref:patatin-like phospholipase family protein n=1 Tax=Pseudomonas sp. NPDC088368 TaxID=3364453 RepID=UPI003817890C
MKSTAKSGASEQGDRTDTRESQSPKRPVFLALQGGGAKGVVHVGGLLAVEALYCDIRGVAGTSAGSIVAALVAAGYGADDLVNLETRTHIFESFGAKYGYHRPTDLFTRTGWFILKSVRNCSAAVGKAREQLNVATNRLTSSKICKRLRTYFPKQIPGVKARALVYKWFIRLLIALMAYFFITAFPTVTFVLLVMAVVLAVWIGNGITGVERVRKLIDKAIADKLTENGYPVSKNVTFADMDNARCVPLKIVATNVAYECLELFCLDRTPNVCVADAVAASICLPFIFRPWPVSFDRHSANAIEFIDGRFLDGGIVSNLPAWPFDEERLLDPSISTIALSIDAGVIDVTKHWMKGIAGTVVNGSGVIHTRAAGKIVTVPLKTKLGMLAFDVSADDVYDLVGKTAVDASTHLSTALVEGPALMREAAKAIQDWFFRELESATAEWHRGHPALVVRVAIAAERGAGVNTLSNVFTAGFENSHLDGDATRRAKGWLFDQALKTGQPSLHIIENGVPSHALDPGERIWNEVRWIACFPLSYVAPQNSRSRNCVVVVDSNVEIDFNISIAKEQLTLFLDRAFEFVTVYDEEIGLMKTVQGANTWL